MTNFDFCSLPVSVSGFLLQEWLTYREIVFLDHVFCLRRTNAIQFGSLKSNPFLQQRFETHIEMEEANWLASHLSIHPSTVVLSHAKPALKGVNCRTIIVKVPVLDASLASFLKSFSFLGTLHVQLTSRPPLKTLSAVIFSCLSSNVLIEECPTIDNPVNNSDDDAEEEGICYRHRRRYCATSWDVSNNDYEESKLLKIDLSSQVVS